MTTRTRHSPSRDGARTYPPETPDQRAARAEAGRADVGPLISRAVALGKLTPAQADTLSPDWRESPYGKEE